VKEYIIEDMPKKYRKECLGDVEDPENFIDALYYRVNNPTDKFGLEYSVVWLFHYRDYYIPIVKTGINTSSPYSMVMCGLEPEDYYEEEISPNGELHSYIVDKLIFCLRRKRYKSLTKNFKFYPQKADEE
jgi:hypothetical protein